MCGIAGIVDSSCQDISALKMSAARMTHALAHRGPDDWGIVTLHGAQADIRSMGGPNGETIQRPGTKGTSQAVILGHRRLAIIDLSPGGHQPMSTPDGRFWIDFNGEIYNYRELRRELEADGVVFRSTSDTEVLLSLFAREGPDCLKKLRGMYAFVVWDELKRELFLARDRFGIKPLYYARSLEGAFLFASEIKALLSSDCVSTAIDEEAEIAFLRRGSIRAPKTFYLGIQSLPPAHWARWDGRELSVKPYWSLCEVLAGEPVHLRDIAEIANHVRQSLTESVKAHMVSDVPVGVFLSGGVDSTAMVAAIRQFYFGPLKTFTVIFPGTQWDEGNLARQAAAHYGTDHAELEVTKEDFFKGFEDLFRAMDQPTVDGVNTYFVSKAACQAGVKVALSGLGGDEFLGGYKSFVQVPKLQKYYRLARQIPLLSHAATALARHLPVHWAPKLSQLLRHNSDELGSLWQDYRALFTDEQIRRFISARSSVVDHLSSSTCSKQPQNLDYTFWPIAFLEIEHFMVPQLLRDSDVFTMCHGLELRTPFVDHLFLGAIREAGTWSKDGAPSHKIALFRQMGGFLPPNHLRQRKMGFTLPFEVWLKEALSSEAASGMSRDMRSFLDKPCYRPFVKGFVRGRVHWSRIWSLYVLERFRAGVGRA